MGAAKGREIGIKSECHAQPQKRNGYWNGDVHFTAAAVRRRRENPRDA